MVESAMFGCSPKGVRFMDAEKDVSKDVAASEGHAASEVSNKQTTGSGDELTERIPDPSADFLKRKARLREEADARPSLPFKGDHTGGYKGNTTSGAFRPSMYGRSK
jgi:hypothetical protein